MSLYELKVFLRGLPPDSRTAQAIFPKSRDELEREYWAEPADRFFLATLIDSMRENTFVQLKLHGDPKKTKRLRAPEPIPRPGVEGRRKTIQFGGRHGVGQLGEVLVGQRAS